MRFRRLNLIRAFASSAAMITLAGFAALLVSSAERAKVAATPDPAIDDPLAVTSGQETAILSGGCFWGIQLVFEHVKGVVKATAGYTGGSAKTAQYEIVSTGTTGHAESVEIVYDPSQVTYGQLLKVFFSVAHDPTELNFQGPDHGTQYRSSIWYDDPDQQHIAQAYITQLDQAKAFPHKIVTQVVPFQVFYPAEAYHQDFAVQNPDNPYIMMFDLPKLSNLEKVLPDLYIAHR